MITVHYHRFDSDYTGVGLWVWDASPNPTEAGREYFPAGSDDFGPYFEVDPAGAQSIGMVPRLRQDWRFKDGGDRIWTPKLDGEVWIVSGVNELHGDHPDVAPRIDSAYLDADCTIHARLSHALPLGKLSKSLFTVRTTGSANVMVTGVRAIDPQVGRARRIEVTIDACLTPGATAMLLMEGYRPAEIVPRHLSLDPDSLRYEGELGAIYTPTHTIFRLFSPSSKTAKAIIYSNAVGTAGRQEFPMEAIGNGVWETTAWGDMLGRHYDYRVVDSDRGRAREAVDYYARCTTGQDGRARIVDPRLLDPPSFRHHQRPATISSPCDAIVYELHLRDFTINADSGVPERLRGTYLGACKTGTRIPDKDIRTGIDHLVDLGVTHVQLLPIQDFDNDESNPTYNWGYMTANFFSPEGWFATDFRGDARIREFKELVDAFHRAGIRVIMDVVYNHTGEQATFEQLTPGYYHRQREDGTFWNGSGTGNEFRSESFMGRKFILDSCRYWIEEYRVDGFRFDLMGLIDIDTMCAVRDSLHAIDPTLMVYGEPWAALGQDGVGISRITYKDVVAGSGIGSFNDNFRNALKGSPDGTEGGYVHHGSGRNGVIDGLRGGLDWAAHPTEAIQYADCHDNLTLWDKTKAVLPEDSADEWVRIQMLTIAILGFSQGVMFLHGGVEFARSKGGNHNSYNAPDSVNRFEWSRLETYSNIHKFTRDVVCLRRKHPVFRLRTREEVDRRLRILDEIHTRENAIALHLNGEGLEGETWRETLLLINPYTEDIEFHLPEGRWQVYIQGLNHSMEPLFNDSGTVWVPHRSVALLARG